MCFVPQQRELFAHRIAIESSKSGPSMWCFVHFDFHLCFAPQRRAFFSHRNFQKWSGNGVFCTCSLQTVLRATTGRTFSTSQLPKVLRAWCVLYILTSKCPSCHNGGHFSNSSTSKSASNPECFDTFDLQMCFAPQRCALYHHLNYKNSSETDVF